MCLLSFVCERMPLSESHCSTKNPMMLSVDRFANTLHRFEIIDSEERSCVSSDIQYILREINLAIFDKAGCLSDLLTQWEII